MKNYQISSLAFQVCESARVLLHRRLQRKQTEATLHLSNVLTYEQIASQGLKDQTELGNRWLRVTFPSVAAVQIKADGRVFDLLRSPKHRLVPFARCGAIAQEH